MLFVRCFRLTFEGRCVDLRGLMCRPSRIDDRCVDLRRWMIDVPTFEDRWLLCRPSKTDDRCEIVATLAQNIDGIVVCELCRGFARQCFHYIILLETATALGEGVKVSSTQAILYCGTSWSQLCSYVLNT